jgi:hypothetical protein
MHRVLSVAMEIQFVLLWSCEIFGIVVNNETYVANGTASFQRHIHDPVLSSLKMEGIRLFSFFERGLGFKR